MKIVHTVHSLEMGGAEVLVAQLCRLQRAQGHQVTLFAHASLGVIGEALRAEGFDITVANAASPLKTMLQYFRRFRLLKPDVVHCHNVAATLHGALGARLAGVKAIISTRHGGGLHHHDLATRIRYNLICWCCDWIAGICEVTCETIRRTPFARRKRVVRVYNGTRAVERTDFQRLGKTGFTLLFVGRLAPEKSLETLIRAFTLALSQVPGLALWIVGGGPSSDELKAVAAELAVADQVRFWGQQSETAPFFSAADAFCMSSVSEGLPMSLLQSMSLGTPSILTDVDGMGEVLRLTGGGLLVPVGDVEAMSESIVRLALDPALHAELSRKAYAAYQQRFTLECMAQGYTDLYRSSRGVPEADER